MRFHLNFALGPDNDESVGVSVEIEAANLEAAVEVGRKFPTRELLAKRVTWIDGKARLTGVNEL